MERALELAASVRASTSPNPWVGAVIDPGGFEGATQPPGGPHAEIVAAGTVRADDPSLTVRKVEGRDPLRVVLGKAPPDARVRPALEVEGELEEVLEELGRRGVLQAVVEGGPTVTGAFHRAGLVDRYVVYLAPALFGGDDGRPLFTGPGAPTIADVWRGRITHVERLGDDLKLELTS